VKTHTLALIEGPQGADSGPEAVGSLGHQHHDLSFHLGDKLACGLRTNPVQDLQVFLTPDMFSGVLLRRSTGGTTLSTLAVEMVPMGATLSGHVTFGLFGAAGRASKCPPAVVRFLLF
jgi:hypothetical protein